MNRAKQDLISLIREVVSDKSVKSVSSQLQQLLSKADELMTSAWHSDVDEPHFRNALKRALVSSTPSQASSID